MTADGGKKKDVVLEQIWKEIYNKKTTTTTDDHDDEEDIPEDPNHEDDDNEDDAERQGTDATTAALLGEHLRGGYTTAEATHTRECVHDAAYNVVPPPIACPAWLCILLPCLQYLPSMQHYTALGFDEMAAEVLRNGHYVRYDASALVCGDIIRLEEGDDIPADCVVISSSATDPHTDTSYTDEDTYGEEGESGEELLVDLKAVTGLRDGGPKVVHVTSTSTRQQRTLFLGGTVVQGRARAMVTDIGTDTVLGQLIQHGNFPPRPVQQHQQQDAAAGHTIRTGHPNDDPNNTTNEETQQLTTTMEMRTID